MINIKSVDDYFKPANMHKNKVLGDLHDRIYHLHVENRKLEHKLNVKHALNAKLSAKARLYKTAMMLMSMLFSSAFLIVYVVLSERMSS
jgi:hypothetical protein